MIMRALILTRVYPNAARPTYGVFVRERVQRVAARCEVQVVAPLPRFPFDLAGRTPRRTVPSVETQGEITVHHPSVLSIPGALKSLDALLYALSLLPFLYRLRRRFPFELIDAHFGYPDGVAAVLLGVCLRCPVVVTLRGHELTLRRKRLQWGQMRVALRRAQVIALSAPLRALAADLGVRPERLREIPNGVDPDRFHPGDRTAARERLGLPHDRLILLTVSAFVSDKGHEQVLAALPALIARHPELLFIAVGSDGGIRSRLPAIRRLIRRLSLDAHVRLEPARPQAEMPTWLQAADLFCLTSAREGFSNALYESLACGVPVIASRVGAAAEVVRNGADGYLVPFFDADAFVAAVLRAVDHPWDPIAIAGRAAARTWDRVAEEVMHAFAATRAMARVADEVEEDPVAGADA
jgi:glycosyltransferase involved in cell wall biosynthesis